MSQLVSHRGHFLLLPSLPRAGERPVVTVEAYTKWYSLYVVKPGPEFEEVPFSALESFEGTPYVDHVPNPDAIEAWADANGYDVDELSLEMVIGRWTREGHQTCPDCERHF